MRLRVHENAVLITFQARRARSLGHRHGSEQNHGRFDNVISSPVSWLSHLFPQTERVGAMGT